MNTDAVDDTCGREQEERSKRDGGDQVIDRHEDRPAERKVRGKRKASRATLGARAPRLPRPPSVRSPAGPYPQAPIAMPANGV
jgi:hypothetical protein